MKLVIDIPEDNFKRIRELAEVNGLSNNLMGYSLLAIAHGTILPKGHGDLIDSRDLETRKFIGVEEHKTLKTDDELSAYQSGWNTAVDEIIKYEPIIIPADK